MKIAWLAIKLGGSVKISFNYVANEGATKNFGIGGRAKSRIHFYDYKKEKGKDPFAVYAKQVIVEEGKSSPKLGSIEKRYYILLPDPENNKIYYKINKSSLKNRLHISNDELKAVKDNKYDKLIESKLSYFSKIIEVNSAKRR